MQPPSQDRHVAVTATSDRHAQTLTITPGSCQSVHDYDMGHIDTYSPSVQRESARPLSGTGHRSCWLCGAVAAPVGLFCVGWAI
jgi:hypothetical protein